MCGPADHAISLFPMHNLNPSPRLTSMKMFGRKTKAGENKIEDKNCS